MQYRETLVALFGMKSQMEWREKERQIVMEQKREIDCNRDKQRVMPLFCLICTIISNKTCIPTDCNGTKERDGKRETDCNGEKNCLAVCNEEREERDERDVVERKREG